MKKKIKVICSLLTIVVCLTACGDSWVKLKITSSIEEYSLTMSSVPGMPINVGVSFDGPPASVTSITLKTNNGSFVEWGEDNKVNNLGEKVKLAGKKIYWTPFGEANEIVDGAKITATITYFDRIIEAVKTTSIRIYKNKDGMYVFR